MWVSEPHALYQTEGARWKRTDTAASQAHVASVSQEGGVPGGGRVGGRGPGGSPGVQVTQVHL